MGDGAQRGQEVQGQKARGGVLTEQPQPAPTGRSEAQSWDLEVPHEGLVFSFPWYWLLTDPGCGVQGHEGV